MKSFITFLAILFLPAAAAAAISDAEVESALDRLDRELTQRDEYVKLRTHRLDSLKAELARPAARAGGLRPLELTMEIAKGYNAFNNDSALLYYTRGYDAARALAEAPTAAVSRAQADSLATEFRLRRACYLSMGGMVNDAVAEYSAVDTAAMQPGLLATYHDAGRQMFSYISTYYSDWGGTFDYWHNRSIEAQHRLLDLLPHGSEMQVLNEAEYYFSIREYSRSQQLLEALLTHISVDSPSYAIATHILAAIAITRGERNKHIYYLTLSAISDVRHATLEVTSLQELAALMFETGDKQRAHNYVTVALNNAVASRASVRMMKTSELLSIVEQDHNAQLALWRTWMYVIITILGISLLALLASLYFVRRQLRHVATMRQQLQTANAAKDVYISQFMTLCSIYMDKLKQFSKIVNRKISSGQTEDLYKLTKSGKFVEDQSVDFYKAFDEAFLHIYPDFLAGVNALLRPEERIVMEQEGVLNTELRILAFIRLGIEDTNRVAQILNLSVNTIYAYRTRLRNKFINRDTFERDILRIGTFPTPDDPHTN
ncbi:MAG: DUF6377 domain-containing protein [Muribaculaceae bacterium]|nr:DUF6377 domain-containing protein [Muribaculaceae bacterium]